MNFNVVGRSGFTNLLIVQSAPPAVSEIVPARDLSARQSPPGLTLRQTSWSTRQTTSLSFSATALGKSHFVKRLQKYFIFNDFFFCMKPKLCKKTSD